MVTLAAIADEFIESCRPEGRTHCSRLGHYCAARGLRITCVEIVTAHGFDATDRPRAGMECVGCRHNGHFCPAKGMCGDQALCVACGTGVICDQVRSIEKMRSPLDMLEEIPAARCRTIEISDADRIVSEVVPVSDWAIKASLDPENLKRGLKRSERAPISARTPKERKAARIKVVKERIPRRVATKSEEVMMEATKKKRKPVPELGDVTFATVAPGEVPASKWGKGIKSPFQEVYDKMFVAFDAGQALKLELTTGDMAATVGKAAQARAKKDGIKVRTAVEGATLWLLAVSKGEAPTQ